MALASRGLAIAVEPRDRVDLALQLGELQLHTGRGLDALRGLSQRAGLERAGTGQATSVDRMRGRQPPAREDRAGDELLRILADNAFLG